MTIENSELIALADSYARCNANHHVESLYGSGGSYATDCEQQRYLARAKLLDAIEAQAQRIAELEEWQQLARTDFANADSKISALQADAERWGFISRHWKTVNYRLKKRPNVLSGFTLTVSMDVNSNSAAALGQEIDSLLAARTTKENT